MRILPDGLHDLLGVVEKGMKEPNKATLKENINMSGVIAEALGPAAKTYIKKCMYPLCKLLSDKQNLVRQKAVESINKWAESVGNEQVITACLMQIEVENPELRTESLKWVLEHKEDIKKCEHSAAVTPLTMCLVDKGAAIRKEAEKVIVEILPYVTKDPFSKQIMSLKPA